MRVFKNIGELRSAITREKDLILDEDVRIEFQVPAGELRDVRCRDLFLMNDDTRFDFTGRDFKGRNFTGGDFNGGDFTGWNFTGRDFNGGDFNGWDFNGGDFKGRNFTGRNFTGGDFNGGVISYYAVFCVYDSCFCSSIVGRRKNARHFALDGKIEIRKS